MTSFSAQTSICAGEASLTGESWADGIVLSYFMEHEPAFRKLDELRKKGWSNPEGDEYFKRQRQKADYADRGRRQRFFNMMKEIGRELQTSTNALNLKGYGGEDIKILDLCMAPGGYTASALKYNPTAKAYGITLPQERGGHELLCDSSRHEVMFLDITMLAGEFSTEKIPSSHPDHDNFLDDMPFLGQQFHLVFCDGQVLRTHERAAHRERHEALRLTVSQLILALQRIRPGGTLVMLLHKVERWDTIELLYQFRHFSSIELFKPKKRHAIRSSFYLIAKNVQPDTDAATKAVEGWKQAWWMATFGGEAGTGGEKAMPDEGHVRMVLDEFGKELFALARPIWNTQASALSDMSFVKA